MKEGVKKKIPYFFIKQRLILVICLFFVLSPIAGYIRLFFVLENEYWSKYLPGFSSLLFLMPFIASALVLVTLTLIFIYLIGGKGIKINLSTFLSIISLNFLFFVISVIFLRLEVNNYPNFLYSHYGITFRQLQLMSLVSALQSIFFVLFYAFDFVPNSFMRRIGLKHGRISLKVSLAGGGDKISFVFIILGLLLLLISSGLTFFNASAFFRLSVENYSDKFGKDFVYVQVLNKYTPLDSAIIHPPQNNNWPAIGNQPMLRFFLYPRVLISGTILDDSDVCKSRDCYFVLIDSDYQGRPVWPEIDVKSNLITFDGSHKIKFYSLTEIPTSAGISLYKVVFK